MCAHRSDLPLSISARTPKRANEALALPGSSRRVGGDFVLTRPRECRFVDRADHCSNDNHLDEAADASVKNQFSRNGLDGIKPKAHPDRRNFQQETESNSGNYPAARKTARVDHYESENNQRLANNDPMKQAPHFIFRAPEIWRLGINIFEKNAVEELAPEKMKMYAAMHARMNRFIRSMALVSCPDCGHQISTIATACPQCGRASQLPSPVGPPPSPPPRPSQSLAEQPPNTLPSGRVPKMPLIAIVGAMLVFGFASSLLVMIHFLRISPEKADAGMAIIGFVFGAVPGGYLGSAVICGFKGKPIFTAIGLVALLLPALGVFPGAILLLLPVIGAIRIAKPNSTWARKYYDGQKLQIARTRFPKATFR